MEENEKCVLCGCETTEKTTTPIDFRANYVEGAGQLCSECFNSIYQ